MTKQDSNVKKGLSTTVDNFKPASMATNKDGPFKPPHDSNYGGWVFPGKPGVD